MLKEIKVNVSMVNQMTTSYSISIKLLETQNGSYVVSYLLERIRRVSIGTMANPKNES